MKSYAESEALTAGDLVHLHRATALVDRVPARIGDEWVRCHELARAVGEVLELFVVDGSYGACDHSWLVLPSGVILDVYVPARMPQVQLCPYWFGAPAMYRSGAERTDLRTHIVTSLVNRMQRGLDRLLAEVERSARIESYMRGGDGARSRWDELPIGRRQAIVHETFSKFAPEAEELKTTEEETDVDRP